MAIRDQDYRTGLLGEPLCPCRDGAHVWLWSSINNDPCPEGTPCACGQQKWRSGAVIASGRYDNQDAWRAEVLRRLDEIERRLDGR